jgi:hypothetical protein
MELELIKDTDSGYITPRVNFAKCMMSNDPKDTADISLGTDNHIWFTFGIGKRSVKFHLGKVLMEAYRLAQED